MRPQIFVKLKKNTKLKFHYESQYSCGQTDEWTDGKIQRS